MLNPRERALALRARGFSVIPIPRPDAQRDGKVPAIAWRVYQTRLPTEDEIRAWFRDVPQNIAVVTGAISGVIVIDADTPDAVSWCTRHLPYTPWQTQTARGFHLWYRHPGFHVANRAHLQTRRGRLAIDVKGDGGYVIAPGSIHASGIGYEAAGDWHECRDAVPRFWPGWLPRLAPPNLPPALPRPTGDVVARARRYLGSIPRPDIGHGSDLATLYAACRLVRGFGLTEGEAIPLLWAWAGGRPGWTQGWIAQKVRHAQRYGTEPVGALR